MTASCTIHPQLFEDLAQGRLTDAEELAALDACEQCRAAWESRLDLGRLLDQAGREEQEILREAEAARRAGDPEAAALVRASLPPASSAGTQAPRPKRGGWMLAAAALFAVIGGSAWMRRAQPPGPTPRPTAVLGGGLTLEEPSAEGWTFGVFRWEYDGGSVERFDVHIYDAATDEPLAQQEIYPEQGTTYRFPDPEQLPDSVRWTVTLILGGKIQATHESTVKR